jgi:large subunit ribosomal protein L10
MNKQEKHQCVEELRQSIAGHAFVAIARNHGLNVADVTDLRRKVFDLGDSGYRVAKNTLLRLAVQGTVAEGLLEHFIGPTVLAYSQDPVGMAKVLTEFSSSNEKIVLMAGLFSGKLLSDKEIEALSKMPSLLELLAQVVSFIQGLGVEIRRLLLAPATELHRLIQLISEGTHV